MLRTVPDAARLAQAAAVVATMVVFADTTECAGYFENTTLIDSPVLGVTLPGNAGNHKSRKGIV
jgi:hypothetical protein